MRRAVLPVLGGSCVDMAAVDAGHRVPTVRESIKIIALSVANKVAKIENVRMYLNL